MFKRHLYPHIVESLRDFPAILVSGARQVGKTTLVKSMMDDLPSAEYITLDDFSTLQSALNDPEKLLLTRARPLIIDEVQMAPILLTTIKKLIDENRKNGQFILTGSANLMTFQKVSESLAGRIALFTLFPLSISEILGESGDFSFIHNALGADSMISYLQDCSDHLKNSSITKDKIESLILDGGYPEITKLHSQGSKQIWFDSYRKTYLERDIRNLAKLENINSFFNLVDILASRQGSTVNKTELSRTLGLNFRTLDKYLALLEMTFQIIRLQPWLKNSAKRLVKSPKIYYTDSGFTSFLLGLQTSAELHHSPLKGKVTETWVMAEIQKLINNMGDRSLKSYYYRTQSGSEIDCIVEKGSRIISIEIKSNSRVSMDDFRHIRALQSQTGSNFAMGIVLYPGNEVLSFGEKLAAIPFNILV